MDIDQEPLDLVRKILAPRELNYLEEIVFLHSWNGKLYREMAEEIGYQESYIKDIGSQLWVSLSEKLGCPVTKKNLRIILTKFSKSKSLTVAQDSQPDQVCQKLEFPGFPLLFANAMYIERPPLEDRAIAAIGQPGGLIRIKAAQGMGKSSLINHIMGVTRQMGIPMVFVDVQQADTEVLGDLDRFLRWFCWNIGQQLNLEPKFEDYWEGNVGSKFSCTTYLQEYLLNQVQQPIIVAIDKLHYLVEYPTIAKNFFSLLRAWYEKGRVRENWLKLRLIIAYSVELDLPIPSHQSPFNIGLPLNLPDLTTDQVKDLADRYELHKVGIRDFNTLAPLLHLVGGHPYLLQLAFYWLRSGYLSLGSLLESAPTAQGIYGEHLRRQWLTLQREDRWLKALHQVLCTPESIHLDTSTAYQLEGMGLVKFQGLKVSLRRELYREYFCACLEGKHD